MNGDSLQRLFYQEKKIQKEQFQSLYHGSMSRKKIKLTIINS